MCICVCISIDRAKCACEGHRKICGSWVSPSTIWVPRIEIKSSRLASALPAEPLHRPLIWILNVILTCHFIFKIGKNYFLLHLLLLLFGRGNLAQVASKVNGQLMRGIPPSIMCIQEIKIRSSDYVGFLVLSRIILFLFLKKKNFSWEFHAMWSDHIYTKLLHIHCFHSYFPIHPTLRFLLPSPPCWY